MDIGRRQFIHSAVLGASLLTAPLKATDIVFMRGTGTSTGTEAGGPSPLLLERAKAALAAHKARIQNHDLLAIADFSKPSRDPRFYVVDLHSGKSDTFLVAHGRGSDPSHTGWVQEFSNVHGSEATSAGSYLVGETYFGQIGRAHV